MNIPFPMRHLARCSLPHALGGLLRGHRWGEARKHAIHALEAARYGEPGIEWAVPGFIRLGCCQPRKHPYFPSRFLIARPNG